MSLFIIYTIQIMTILKRLLFTVLVIPVSILDVLINSITYCITGDITKYSLLNDLSDLLKRKR